MTNTIGVSKDEDMTLMGILVERNLMGPLRLCFVMMMATTILLLCLSGCGASSPEASIAKPNQSKAEQKGVVQLAPASMQFVDVLRVGDEGGYVLVNAPGRVAFRDGAVSEVGAPISGRITDVHVRVGQPVRRGEPLITLNSPDAAVARAGLAAARINLEATKDTLRRQVQLLERGVGIESEKFMAEIAVVEARAELERAENEVSYLGEGSGTMVTVRAPFSGNVVARTATVGASVEPGGDPMVVVGNPQALWVEADVFDRDLIHVRDGALASIELSNRSQPVTGKVVSVGVALQSESRRASVYIELDDEVAMGLKPGMFARATIKGDSVDGVVIPASAILIRDGSHTVAYVQRGEFSFERRDVVIGQSVDGQVQVFAGLLPGDQVAIRGAILLDATADELL